MDRGYLQIYTGDGKGKTTAALGLAIRALGAGLKVFIGQFAKGMPYSEHAILLKFSPDLIIKQYGQKCFIVDTPSEEDHRLAQEGWEEVSNIVQDGSYDIVILDELTIANYYKLISVDDTCNLIKRKNKRIELIITGRKAHSQLIEMADLVTEMKEIKHYYQQKVQARKGIEK